MAQFLEREINNGKTEIGCPETNCKKGKITPGEVKKIVVPELFQKFINLAKASSALLSENLKRFTKPESNTVETKPSFAKTIGPKYQKKINSKYTQSRVERPYTDFGPHAPAQRLDGLTKHPDLMVFCLGTVFVSLSVIALFNPCITPIVAVVGVVTLGYGLLCN